MEENRKRYIERKMKEQRKEKGNSDADNEGNVCQRRGFRIKKIVTVLLNVHISLTECLRGTNCGSIVKFDD
jgi:hypothetical protein